jgi:fibrillarin-like rRNA methylase
MVDGIFEDFADEINAEIAKNVSKSLLKRNREIAKKLKARNRPIDEIVEDTGLTKEEVEAL